MLPYDLTNPSAILRRVTVRREILETAIECGLHLGRWLLSYGAVRTRTGEVGTVLDIWA